LSRDLSEIYEWKSIMFCAFSIFNIAAFGAMIPRREVRASNWRLYRYLRGPFVTPFRSHRFDPEFNAQLWNPPEVWLCADWPMPVVTPFGSFRIVGQPSGTQQSGISRRTCFGDRAIKHGTHLFTFGRERQFSDNLRNAWHGFRWPIGGILAQDH
jgi:hypothetical protein